MSVDAVMLSMKLQPYKTCSWETREAKRERELARKVRGEDSQVDKSKPAEPKKPRAPRGRTGILSELMGMPKDIFYEIVSWLKPLDLLHLSRSSKYLRSLIMSKDNSFLWKAARKNISGMPDCPAILAEPRYAAVMFDQYCFACGIPRSSCTNFSLALRFCGPCFKANIYQGVVMDYRNMKTDWSLLIAVPKNMHPRKDPAENHPRDCYYWAEFNAVRDQLNSLRRDSSGLQRFIEDRRAFAQQMQEHGFAVSLWHQAGLLKRYEDGKQGKKDRKKEINEKLSELGYSEADYPTNEEWTKIFDQPTRLSDRIWKNIRPKLEELLEQEKNARIASALRARVRQRRTEIHVLYAAFVDRTFTEEDRSFLPNLYDTGFLPSAVALATADDAQDEITENRFAAIEDHLLVEMQEHAQNVKRDLYRILADSRRPSGDESTMVELDPTQLDAEVVSASSLFICENCEPGTYRVQPRASKTHSAAGICAHWREQHPLVKWPAPGAPQSAFSLSRKKADQWVIARPQVVLAIARLALDALGLAADTPYAHVDELVRTGKLVCVCGDPKLPTPSESSWARLVQRVWWQRVWYKRKKAIPAKSTNEGELQKRLLDDHQLADGSCCLKILAEGEETVYPDYTPPSGVADEIKGVIQASGTRRVMCRICPNMHARRNWHQRPAMESLSKDVDAIAHHMMTKHGEVLEKKHVYME